MKRILASTILLVLIVSITSCRKKDQTSDLPQKKVYLSKIITSEESYTTFEYDEQGRMTKQSTYNFAGLYLSYLFYYNTQGQLSSCEQDYTDPSRPGYKFIYSYNADGTIDKMSQTVESGELLFSVSYLNTTSGMSLIMKDEAGANTSKIEYAFIPGTKNTKELKYYIFNNTDESWQMVLHHVLTYDTKTAPYTFYPTGFLSPIGFDELHTLTPRENNILSIKDEDIGSTSSFTYEYNEEGYPIKATYDKPGSDPETHTYEYINK
ncbi:hypothetical protein [Niabella aurantiaca]|uniref:hypothetical protein n=1 Tax=Niabella aurantiaca TaxID=379900 RepID=UPI00039FB11C|nr:hypothetical protein [Niabella aurantiaca]